MSERKAGWYFITMAKAPEGVFEAARFESGLWFIAGRDMPLKENMIGEVVQRIPR